MSPISISEPPATKIDAHQQRHDVLGALQTLTLAVSGLEAGYRFDDRRAELKILALRRAAGILTEFCNQQLALERPAP